MKVASERVYIKVASSICITMACEGMQGFERVCERIYEHTASAFYLVDVVVSGLGDHHPLIARPIGADLREGHLQYRDLAGQRDDGHAEGQGF